MGKGNVFFLRGWCYHPERRIRALSVVMDGVAHPVANYGLPRLDVFRRHYGQAEFKGYSLTSGFWCMIPMERIESPREVDFQLEATLSGGKVHRVEAGRFLMLPAMPLEPVCGRRKAAAGDDPLIAICMTTYNPPAGLFRKQVDSIRRQTYGNWTCIISDDCSQEANYRDIAAVAANDERFVLLSNDRNVGYYHNFERCLAKVPEGAAYVALADQDDQWHEDKLASLLAAFDPETELVYSDMNIVNEAGEIVHTTYWTTRKNNFSDFSLLILANTVTGAAALFRRELLPDLLPFPEKTDDVYHDHFIGCVALAKGKIGYVDRPLYDYCQHGENVIGHYVPLKKRAPKGGDLPKVMKFRPIKYMGEIRNRARNRLAYHHSQYYNNFLRRILFSKIIKARCTGLDRKKAAILDKYIGIERSVAYLLWLVVKNRICGNDRITMHLDGILSKSVVSLKLQSIYYGFRRFFFRKRPA